MFTDISNHILELKENGYTIIPNVYNEEEIIEYWRLFNKWHDEVDNLEEHHSLIDYNGIYKHHEVGHQRFAWLARTNPKILNIFKQLWNTDELVTGFDGCCYYPPNYKGEHSFWTHTDQSSRKKGVHCYQSILSMTNNIERTFIVYKGSHLLHENYFKDNNIDEPRDWHLFNEDYINTLQDTKEILKINEGDLLIWDSRTYHQNTCGNSDCIEERLVQYLCFLPKNSIHNNEEQQKKRLKYYKRYRTTSHWPYPLNPVPKQANFYNYYNPEQPIYIDYDALPIPEIQDLEDKIYELL